jgi:hypothetical protein
MQIKTSLLLIVIIDLMAALFTTPYAIHVEIVEGSGLVTNPSFCAFGKPKNIIELGLLKP